MQYYFRNCKNLPDESFTFLCLHDQEWLKYEKQIHLSISVTTVLSWTPMTRLKSSLVLSIDRLPSSSKKQCEAVTAQLSLIWKTNLFYISKKWTQDDESRSGECSYHAWKKSQPFISDQWKKFGSLFNLLTDQVKQWQSAKFTGLFSQLWPCILVQHSNTSTSS